MSEELAPDPAAAFEAFMAKKKIDIATFRADQPTEAARQAYLFVEMGPKSYDQRQKFFFNEWRLHYPLAKLEVAG
jgi:5-bromo-4-chloroindolyl phosphate hydrolysis protein